MIGWPKILWLYLGRMALTNILVAFLILAGISFLIDMVELSRRVGHDISFLEILHMTVIKAPVLWQDILPFAVLLGTMIHITHLISHSEITAIQASGVSVWSLLLPGLILAFILGLLSILALNPLAATARQHLNDQSHEPASAITSKSRLWLKEAGRNTTTMTQVGAIISTTQLSDVTLVILDSDGIFDQRIEGPTAIIMQVGGHSGWLLPKANIHVRGQGSVSIDGYFHTSALTFTRLYQKFSPAENLHFWQLRDFIQTTGKAGINAHHHHVYYWRLLLMPFLFVTLFLISAAFALRFERRNSRLGFLISGLSIGFTMFFVNSLFYKIALTSHLPAAVALVTPIIIGGSLSLAFLLHAEES